MNAMTKALIEAGVPVPTAKERLWRCIHEQPGISIKQLKVRLKDMPGGTMASQLQILKHRDMVYTKPLTGGVRGRGYGTPVGYYTDLDKYKLLPPVGRTPPPKANGKPRAPAPSPSPSPEADLDRLIDNLTIKQAKSLMDKLRRTFA